MGLVTKWTPDELAMLRAMYADTCTADVAKAIGRSRHAVWVKARQLGLSKSAEYMQSTKSGRIPVGGGEHAFKPNPNKQRVERKPKPVQPIGATRVSWNGVLLIKTTDANIDYYDKWLPMHRVVWTQANGPVPKGCIVVFKDGCKTTDPMLITPDKVECITRHKHAMRNAPHNLPPEIQELVKLKSQINRRVNEIKRKANGND